MAETNNYTSINQFLDKSIIYAAYALKEQNFTPHFIVSAPSSSKFNEYYCNNLSNKLGITYIPDFFKRNVINVKFDKQTEYELNDCGATESDKLKISRSIISGVYGEIGLIIKNAVKRFAVPYQDYFNNISKEHYSREKIDFDSVISILTGDLCNMLLNNSANNNDSTTIYRNIIRTYLKGGYILSTQNEKINHARSEMLKMLKAKIGQRNLQVLLKDIDIILKQYSDKIDNGFNVNAQRFKITMIEKRFRKCIHNVYIISDKALNHNNELQTKYKNANFLIFDEDINSGATLKLVCDALQEKLENSDNNIFCLVNAYSNKGS